MLVNDEKTNLVDRSFLIMDDGNHNEILGGNA